MFVSSELINDTKKFEEIKKKLIRYRDEMTELNRSDIKVGEKRIPLTLIIIQLVVVIGLLFYFFVLTTFSPAPPEINYSDLLLQIILFTVVTVLSIIVYLMWPGIPTGGICFHLSVTAAEKLEKNQLVDGSFLVTKLMEYLPYFLKDEKIKIEEIKSDLKTLFLGLVEELDEQRSAVGKAVLQNAPMRLSFAKHLYKLAASIAPFHVAIMLKVGKSEDPANYKETSDLLLSKKDDSGTIVDYDEVHLCLRFFYKSSQKYFQEPKTFLGKHKTLNTVVKKFAEFGKIVIVPLLGFILWLVFGYR
jgi:hypothetical protein